MAVRIRDAIMEPEVFEVPLNFSPKMWDALTTVVAGKRVPRLLWAEVRDPDGDLVAPPMLLRKVGGDKDTGLTIGGVGPAWVFGSNGVGPLIRDASFYSPTSRLDNGSFPPHLGLLYWEASQETGWEHSSTGRTEPGSAYAATNPGKDDPLTTRKYPAEPGQQWFAYGYFERQAGALGRARLRLTFHSNGKFTHPNLFPEIGAGAWDTAGQVSNNPDAAVPAFVVTGSTMTGRTPLPLYQLVLNPKFEDDVDYWFYADQLWENDGSASPDLATSIHYNGSGFILTDVITINGDATITSSLGDFLTPDDVTGMLLEGPGIPPYTYVLSVNDAHSLEMSVAATEDNPIPGVSVAFRPQHLSRAWFTTCAENDSSTTSQYPVTKGETWSGTASVLKTDNANGSATINFAKVKTATDDHLAGVFWESFGSISTGGPTVLSTLVEPNVRVITGQTTIEDETTALGFFVELAGNTDGRWWFSNFYLRRVLGNKDWLPATDPMVLTPERTHSFEMPVTPGPLLNKEAKTRLLVHLFGDGRDPITLTSSDVGPVKEGETATPRIVLSVTPPSGYDVATTEIVLEDTFNDVFTYGELTVVDQDRSTVVADHLTGQTQPTWLLRQILGTAPGGTEEVSVSLVAENGGSGWLADDFWFGRFGVTWSTHTDVIDALLLDPDTGLPHDTGCAALTITAGSVEDPGYIPYEWRPINIISRDALDWFVAVVASPSMEWLLGTDLALSVGYAADLFTTHPIAHAYLPEDLDVQKIEGAATDVETKASRILVLGSVVPSGGGRSRLIEASADVADVEPLNRTRVIQDGTVDNLVLAQARADDEATREADPPFTVTVRLNELDVATAAVLGVPVRTPARPGDWVPVYRPDAGLEGTEEVSIRGRAVKPRIIRVQVRERSIPKGSVTMRKPDGSTFPLEGVIWDEAETVLTLGDRPPEWRADPEGVAAGVQYLNDRARTQR